MAIERIRINQQGVGNKHWKLYQVIEAFKDPMVWAFVFYSVVANIPNGKYFQCNDIRITLISCTKVESRTSSLS